MHKGEKMKFFYEPKDNEANIFKTKNLDFPAHIHNHIELVYMLHGKSHAFSGGIECEINTGDFFIAFPNYIHYYDTEENHNAIVAIIPCEMLPEYKNILFKKTPVSPVITNTPKEAGELMEMMCNYKGTYKNNVYRGLFIAILGIIFEKMSFTTEKNNSYTTIQTLLEYCENNFKNEISVKKTAEDLHLSASYISHTFTDKIRISFRDYINSLRLNEAHTLLINSDMNMTEIALMSGFETIRTFNRAFKKHYGTSPSEYRKKINLTKL